MALAVTGGACLYWQRETGRVMSILDRGNPSEVRALLEQGLSLHAALPTVPNPAGIPHLAGIDRIVGTRRKLTEITDQFVVGWLGARAALLLPDTSMTEAASVAERLLRGRALGPSRTGASAGIATVYGEVEGEAAALLAAAEEALDDAAPGEVSRSKSLQGRPRVLIVDDDPVFATALASMVTRHGWEGHPSHDAVDALERVRRDTYSALFVDLVLAPKLNGVEILKEAVRHHPTRPAVLMSGKDSNHAAVLDALELGPVMFVRKPVSEADLDAALQMFRSLLPGLGPRLGR